MEIRTFIAKKIMKLYPNIPREDDFAMWEIFKQERFISANSADRKVFYLSLPSTGIITKPRIVS